ncbi:MAG: TIGR00266 family protein, partial [Desulfurococcales archaeon]|nr:TIGR00266 family protein [Desulfurococcales archaeon]
ARGEAEVWLAPGIAGDVRVIDLEGTLYVQDSSYVAHTGSVEVSVGWRGLRGLVSEGELFWLKLEGRGRVVVNAYGAMEELSLGPGERVTVDNMHFVAMDGSVGWRIRKFGGLKSFIFGGEGFVIDVTGPGRVWVQTRNLPLFARILGRFLAR